MPENRGKNNNFDFGDLEFQIRKGVSDITRSVNAGLRDAGINISVDDIYREFRGIGRDISREIGRAARGGDRYSRSPGRNKYEYPPYNKNTYNKNNSNQNPTFAQPKFKMPSAAERLANKNKNKIANLKTRSSLFMVFGWIFVGIAAFSLLSVGGEIVGGAAISQIVGSVVSPVVWFVASGLMFGLCSSAKKRRIRYSRCLSMTEGSDSADLREIASVAGVSEEKIRRDFQSMIDAGYFGAEASVDVGAGMFYRTKAAASAAREARRFSSERESAAASTEGDAGISIDELDYNSISDFDKIVDRIRSLNDDIADEKVSERIYKIEAVTTHIFNYIKEHPDKFQSIRSFMSYYLPTTLKLLASYSAIEKAGVAGKNMSEAKESIESTLDMLVEGFSMQLDKLYEDENLDITSDVEVLKQMLAKDGLSRDDFSKFMSGYGGTAVN